MSPSLEAVDSGDTGRLRRTAFTGIIGGIRQSSTCPGLIRAVVALSGTGQARMVRVLVEALESRGGNLTVGFHRPARLSRENLCFLVQRSCLVLTPGSGHLCDAVLHLVASLGKVRRGAAVLYVRRTRCGRGA